MVPDVWLVGSLGAPRAQRPMEPQGPWGEPKLQSTRKDLMGGNVSILCWLVPWGHPGPREGGTFPPGEGWDHYNRGRGGP